MPQGTDPALNDVYRRIGALEANVEQHSQALAGLRHDVASIRRSLKNLDLTTDAQVQELQSINTKLEFVQELKEFIMKAEAVVSFLKKSATVLGYAAKVAAAAAVVYAAYASGGIEAAVKAVGVALGSF